MATLQPAAQFPGTQDPCLACGPQGSTAYMQCHAALAAKVGQVPQCAQSGIQNNQQQIANAATAPLTALSSALGMFQYLFNALPSYGIHIALFLVALMLVIIGLWILASGTAPQGEQK